MQHRQNASTRSPQGRARQALGVLIFIRELVFLLDATAALPRKSDPGGAASLPRQTIALSRGSALRKSHGRAIVPHGPILSREAASQGKTTKSFI